MPDSLGADMHGYNTTVPKPAGTPDEHPDKEHMFAGSTRFSLVSGMTAMLALGLPLKHVVAMATCNAARMAGMQDVCGSLTPGMEADVSVLHEDLGRWVLRDNEGTQLVTDRVLRPAFCLRKGVRYDADASILPEPMAA
jgi:dihydroorotase